MTGASPEDYKPVRTGSKGGRIGRPRGSRTRVNSTAQQAAAVQNAAIARQALAAKREKRETAGKNPSIQIRQVVVREKGLGAVLADVLNDPDFVRAMRLIGTAIRKHSVM